MRVTLCMLVLGLGFVLVQGCGLPSTPLEGVPADLDARLAASVYRIGVGSCNKTSGKQDYWDLIVARKPKLWIWGGDIVYADTEDMAKMEAEYKKQKAFAGYARLLAMADVIGIWDDHDYGDNDADKTYPKRKESQQLLLDFLDEPADSPRRKQEGVYAAYTYDVGDKKLKVILLDVRYHRDRASDTMLSEAQWTWLEEQLKESKADVHLLVSGSQFLRDDTSKDTWAEFPKSQARLLALLKQHKVPGALLLTGDIHAGEVSRSDEAGLGYPLYEFTSSGLTHGRFNFKLKNKYRKYLLNEQNYGMIDFEKRDGDLIIHLQLYDMKGTLRTYQQLPLSTLQPK